jgi:hypothetical protein
MIRRLQYIAVFFVMLMMMTGCSSRVKPASIPGYAERGIRIIVVMPVKAPTVDPKVARLMRDRILETLYFKGYPRIPLGLVDGTLAKVYDKVPDSGVDIPPQAVRTLLNADAVLYVTVHELRTSTAWLYAATIISATFELRDGKTGETIWKARPQNVERSFDVTAQRLERTVYQVLEPALQTMVEQALQGLPEGPDTVK